MDTYKKICLFSLLIVMLSPLSSWGQIGEKEANVTISGEVKGVVSLSVTALDKMEKTEVIATDGKDKRHTYAGATLANILKGAGVTLGGELRGENLSKYILVEASDGYQVLFSLAEVDPEFSEKNIILANRRDGNLLPPDEGPFRIIIEGEKRKARFIRQVVKMEIKYAD